MKVGTSWASLSGLRGMSRVSSAAPEGVASFRRLSQVGGFRKLCVSLHLSGGSPADFSGKPE